MAHSAYLLYIFYPLALGKLILLGELFLRPSDACHAEFHFACFHQLLATGDDGGASGTDVVYHEEMLACQVGGGMQLALFVVVVVVEVEYVPYVVLPLPAVLVSLAFHEDVSPYGIDDDGQVCLQLNASGYPLALVVASLLLSLGGKGDGDDGIDAVKEMSGDAFAGDETAHIDADVGTVAVLQGIEDVAGGGVAAIIEEGAASLDGYQHPEHLCHLVLVRIFPGLGAWQAQ